MEGQKSEREKNDIRPIEKKWSPPCYISVIIIIIVYKYNIHRNELQNIVVYKRMLSRASFVIFREEKERNVLRTLLLLQTGTNTNREFCPKNLYYKKGYIVLVAVSWSVSELHSFGNETTKRRCSLYFVC